MTNSVIQQNSNPVVNEQIDITGDICPMTFVRTKLRMERMSVGEVLEVILNEGEPLENVPRSAGEMGWEVLAIEEMPARPGQRRILIRKT